MPIFDPIVPNVPAAERIANQVVQQGNQLLQQLVRSYQQSYALVWQNSQAQPGDVIAAFGTQATKVFTASASLAAFINSFLPNAVPTTYPPGWSVAFHEDGSATASYAKP